MRDRILPTTTFCRILLATVLISFLLVTGARASILPHALDLRIEATPANTEIGQALEGILLLTAAQDLEVQKLELVAEGWSIEAFETPQPRTIRSGETWRLPFAAIPFSDTRPLELRVHTQEGVQTLMVGLAPREIRRRQEKNSLAQADPSASPPAGATARTSPELAQRLGLIPNEPMKAGDASKGTPRTIRVHGSLVYERTDGVQMGAYGIWIEVYDLDAIGSQHLGSWFVDLDGSFDFDVTYNETVLDPDPDLELRFRADNGTVFVRPPGVLRSPYSWTTGPWTNFTGTDLNVGTLMPLAAMDHEVMHIVNSIQRAHRIFVQDGQAALPQVGVVFPDPVWPHYDPNFKNIHLPRDYDSDPADPNNELTDYQWRERVQIHEYGHHLMHERATIAPFDYCNGICDGGSCGHCVWCEESENIAWSEGWPNWFSNYCTSEFPSLAGDTAYSVYNFEPSPHCIGEDLLPVCLCDAWMTEGFFAAFLNDIVDPVDLDGSDPRAPFGLTGVDDLHMGAGPIYLNSFGTGVTTPRAFVDVILARYSTITHEIWSTARLNGFDLDTEFAPGVVGTLTSPSHPVGSPSKDAVVQMTWTPAQDDISGVQGYNIAWDTIATPPGTGPFSLDLADVTTWSSPPSGPGEWYFTIRAVDHAGNVSDSYATYGPITILPPDPANLLFAQPSGWYSPLVPRPTADATASFAPAPFILQPANATYWASLAVTNDGQLTAPQLNVRIYVDDLTTHSVSAFAVPAQAQQIWLNQGPLMAPPGRHTLWAELDPDNLIYEMDETDNLFGQPWVWEPRAMARDEALQSPRPGMATAGWEALTGLIVLYIYNADGFRMTSYDGFHAASLRATDNAVDYDLRLYAPASGPTSGFYLYDAWSNEPAGQLDVVITNSGAGGLRDYDLGVLNLEGAYANYELRTHGAGAAAVGDSVTVPVAADEYLFLRQFWVSAADTGAVSVRVSGDPVAGPWNLAVFDPGTIHTELSAAAWDTTSDTTGEAHLALHLGQVGMYAMVAHRDPIHGAPATSVIYEIERTPPDLVPHTPATWYAAIVPRETGGPFITLPAPGLLPTDQPVFLYGASMNAGPNAANATTTSVEVDGNLRMNVPATTLAAGATSLSQFGTLTVSGGRHTFAFGLDQPGTVEELDEANNRVAEQYVFDPVMLDAQPLVANTPPPDRTGGLSDVPPGRPRFYNCDGYRVPSPEILPMDTGWVLGSTMPTRSEDVDLRAHPAAASGTQGFETVLAQSNWAEGQSDFVLVRPDSVAGGTIDLGVVGVRSESGYTVEARGDVLLDYTGIDSDRFYEGLSLKSEQTAQLFAFELRAGTYTVEVLPEIGDADLGLSVFTPGTAWALGKGEESSGAVSWQGDPRENELVVFELESDGLALVVAWKVGATDLPLDQTFTLRIAQAVGTDAPTRGEPAPRRVAITRAMPNPFNPRLEIRFEIGSNGPVSLEIYDLRGHRVATLAQGVFSAGEHREMWMGMDDSGRPVASGVYFVKLVGPGGTDTSKVALVR